MTAAALTRLSDVEPEQVSWLWPGRIPVGKLVALDGDPGVGKSTLALTIAATITTGGDWPDGSRCDYPGDVLVMSAEDGLGDTIRPRLDAAGADTTRVHSLDGQWMTDDTGGRSLATVALKDGATLRDAITETGARLLIVDVMMAYLGNTDSHKDQAMRAVLTPLADIAAGTGCTILLLRHPPKGQQAKAIHAGGGSIGIIGAARVGLLAVTDPDDTDTRVLTVTKTNLAAMPPSLAYRLDTADANGVETVTVQWMGEHHANATELVTAIPDETGNTAVVLALVNARTKTTAHDVTDAFPHITYENARKVLSRLAAKGKILRVSNGVYSPCHSVTVSQTQESSRSDYITDCDTNDELSQTDWDTCDTVTPEDDDVSQTETIADQQEHIVCDTVTTGTPIEQTTHSPDPGHSSISSTEGDAKLENAGVGRTCKTPYCDALAEYSGLCLECFRLRKIDSLVSGVAEREKAANVGTD